jgi:hypothetical protein
VTNLTPALHKKQTRKIHQTIQRKQITLHTRTKEVNRLRGEPNEKNNQHTKEPATGQKGKNVRKRETMCETTYPKGQKEKQTRPDKCNRKKNNVNKTS